ncbi:unnamed protein product [Owenia fusiformis]|uniref:Uncharacterized protein n=1 Tax=Owenia fusiformis TaxID=6347 RepID=A0A8J1XKC0_OWEFU|nr:unnamed protein product [Owenia fusiformis]
MRLGSLTGLLTVFLAVYIEDTYAGTSCCHKTREELKEMISLVSAIEETLTTKMSDLKAGIKEEVSSLATGISSDVDTLTAGISTLTKMVSTLSNAISSIKTDVSDIKAENAGIKRDIAALVKTLNKTNCELTPCENDGTCNETENGYTCQCKSGYTGRNCETDIDECDSSPCQNEGTCIDEVNRYTCKCKAEFAGVNCTITIGRLKTKPIVTNRTLTVGFIHDIAVTCSGHIVATDINTAKIYDRDYTLIKDIGKEFSFVTVTSDDKLAFTTFSSSEIHFYTTDGSFIRNINVTVEGARLTGLTSLSTGELVVCDGKTDRVYIVDQYTGNATPISANGTFETPNYVTINNKGVIIVTDYHGDSVKGLSRTGSVLFSYGKDGPKPEEMLAVPHGVKTDSQDYIVVAEAWEDNIHLLTPNGTFHSYLLTASDGVIFPRAVGINKDGQVMVGDNRGRLFTITYRE